MKESSPAANSADWKARRAVEGVSVTSIARVGYQQDGADSFALELLSKSHGPWRVAAVGATVTAGEITQLVRGCREKFTEHLKLWDITTELRKWAVRSAKVS